MNTTNIFQHYFLTNYKRKIFSHQTNQQICFLTNVLSYVFDHLVLIYNVMKPCTYPYLMWIL